MAIQLAFWEESAGSATNRACPGGAMFDDQMPPSGGAGGLGCEARGGPLLKPSPALRGRLSQRASAVSPPSTAAERVTPADQRRAVCKQLQQQVQQVQTGQRSVGANSPVISCGSEALDRLLPQGGLAPGGIAEWVATSQGSGAGWLALIAARQALHSAASGQAGCGSRLVVLDAAGTFYPPAAIAMGIPAASLVLVRPAQRADFLWVADQALRCSAVAAVWGPLGEWLDPRDARRLQLAAEAGQTSALWVRPAAVADSPSFAEVRWHVSGVPAARPLRPSAATDAGRLLRVELARCRGGTSGAAMTVRMDPRNGTISKAEPRHDHSTAAVHLAAQLARPKVVRSAKKRTA